MEKDQPDNFVKFDEWMGSDVSDHVEIEHEREDVGNSFAIDKFSRGGKKSHLLLQLQKTYKDDSRFKLNRDFSDIDTTKLPKSVLNNLTSKEYDDLVRGKQDRQRQRDEQADQHVNQTEAPADVLDDTNAHQWDAHVDLESEK